MKARSYCLFGLVIFIVLSAIDLVQTWVLIQLSGGRVAEGNPIAERWLAQYDWPGLVFFKAGAVLAFAGAVVVLARYRPLTGALVVTFGCGVLIAVTLYSRQLVTRLHPSSASKTSQQRLTSIFAVKCAAGPCAML